MINSLGVPHIPRFTGKVPPQPKHGVYVGPAETRKQDEYLLSQIAQLPKTIAASPRKVWDVKDISVKQETFGVKRFSEGWRCLVRIPKMGIFEFKKTYAPLDETFKDPLSRYSETTYDIERIFPRIDAMPRILKYLFLEDYKRTHRECLHFMELAGPEVASVVAAGEKGRGYVNWSDCNNVSEKLGLKSNFESSHLVNFLREVFLNLETALIRSAPEKVSNMTEDHW